jgi:pyruvate,water dikinase
MPGSTTKTRPAAAAAQAATTRGGTAQVVTLGAAAAVDQALVGGKAARLGEMIAAELPVPPAFCVTTAAFEEFMRTAAPRPPSGATPAAMRELVLAAEIPAHLASAILEAYAELGRPRVAVRSSAVGEDSAAQSFAGQHDTILDVAGDDALLQAVKACWASLWSERAAVYRDAAAPVQPMAVVVQRMVHADVAGVLFTADPVGREANRIVVEACWGLGEGLVAGRVASDFFALDDRTLDVLDERVRYKATKCVPTEPGRVGLAKVDATARNMPCLTRDQLAELGALARRVRDHYGAEQDIEWAVHDGAIYLLQTRPITTRPAPASNARTPYLRPQPEAVQQGTLWSRMDIGEIFTGLMTPLGLSFAQYYQRHVHADCGTAVGVRDSGDVSLQMGYLQGHVYLNISYTAYLLGQCLPTRDQRHFTKRFASEEIDLSTYTNPFGRFPGGLRGLRSTLFWLAKTDGEMRRMTSRAESMATSRLHEFDRSRRIDLRRMSRPELSAELDRRLAYFHDMHVGYMPYYINAFGFYGLLTELCAKWLGDEGENLQNRIKTDMSSLRTVEGTRELWTLAQAAKERHGVIRIIRDTPIEKVADALRADDEGRIFWQNHVEPFLRENGTRGRQEMELSHPRWIDDPSYIFQMVRRYAEDGRSVDEILARGSRYSEQDAHTALARLPRGKRAALERLIGMYSLCSRLRELTRMSMITSIWLVRNVVYEVGRRLVDEGVLHSLDEVAYLDFDAVRGYLGSRMPASEAFPRAAIDEARRTHQYHRRLPDPPLSLIGEYDPARQPRPAAGGCYLDGLAASPGRVVGRARVIEDLVWQADEFQSGEILVAEFTDASWTPLFAVAGGVVTDVGSMLSHSSIVAREFGVPSVVNTKHATRYIATGDLIAVDGDTGTVEILDDRDEKNAEETEK